MKCKDGQNIKFRLKLERMKSKTRHFCLYSWSIFQFDTIITETHGNCSGLNTYMPRCRTKVDGKKGKVCNGTSRIVYSSKYRVKYRSQWPLGKLEL